MGAFESVGHSLRHYADFKGRASRSEFWIFFLFVMLVSMLGSWFGWRGGGLIGLLLFIPQMSVAVRRLHDVNCSGKELAVPFLMMVAVGFVGRFPGFLPRIVTLGVFATGLIFFAALLRHLIKEGSKVPNRYGPSPTAFSFAR